VIRFVIILLIVFAVGTGAAYYLRAENGYVLIAFGHWMLETSLVGFLAATVLLVIALMVLIRVISAGLRLPSSVRAALDARRRNRAQAGFISGVALWLAGRDARAEVELSRRAADHEAGHLNHLLAARAAQALGESERRDHYLRLAAQADDTLGNEALALFQARVAADADDMASAREALEALRARDPGHPRVLRSLADLLARSQDWTALLALLHEYPRASAWSAEQWRERLAIAVTGACAEAQRLEDVKAVWSKLSRAHRALPPVRLAYARACARLNAEAEAIAVIHQGLEQSWEPALALLFTQMSPPDAMSALASAEQWLQQHGEQPELLLAAATTCRRNKLWGKARSYLDALIERYPSPAAHLEYGRLCLDLKQEDEARKHFAAGLERAVG
jgi:HemY protein